MQLDSYELLLQATRIIALARLSRPNARPRSKSSTLRVSWLIRWWNTSKVPYKSIVCLGASRVLRFSFWKWFVSDRGMWGYISSFTSCSLMYLACFTQQRSRDGWPTEVLFACAFMSTMDSQGLDCQHVLSVTEDARVPCPVVLLSVVTRCGRTRAAGLERHDRSVHCCFLICRVAFLLLYLLLARAARGLWFYISCNCFVIKQWMWVNDVLTYSVSVFCIINPIHKLSELHVYPVCDVVRHSSRLLWKLSNYVYACDCQCLALFFFFSRKNGILWASHTPRAPWLVIS